MCHQVTHAVEPVVDKVLRRFGKSSCLGLSSRDLRRRFSAGIACWNKPEIAPPSFSNHSRYGTLEDVCVL